MIRAIKSIGIIVVGLLVSLLFWGLAVQPQRIQHQEEVVHLAGVGSGWQGRRFAVISNFRIGDWKDNTPTIKRVVAELIDDRPAFVLILGDFFQSPLEDPEREIQITVDLLRPLANLDIPTFALLGPQDYKLDPSSEKASTITSQKFIDYLEATGIIVLQNEAVAVAPPNDSPIQLYRIAHRSPSVEKVFPLYLVGKDAYAPEGNRPEISVEEVPSQAPRIVIINDKSAFLPIPTGEAPLALVGQAQDDPICLPAFVNRSGIFQDPGQILHPAGWLDGLGQPGNRLYINRGIGTGRSIQINCSPSITYFTLLRQE